MLVDATQDLAPLLSISAANSSIFTPYPQSSHPFFAAFSSKAWSTLLGPSFSILPFLHHLNCPNVLQYFYFRGCPFPHPWPTFSFHQFLVPREFSKATQIMPLARKLKLFYLYFGHHLDVYGADILDHLDVYGTDILEDFFNLMLGNNFLKIFFRFTTATRLGSYLILSAINFVIPRQHRMHVPFFIHFVRTVYHSRVF